MADNNDFYHVSAYGDNLVPGEKIRLEHSIYFQAEHADISRLTALPAEKLQAMREESAAAEHTIFDGLREKTKSWETQAAQTLLLDKAIEYIKTPAVKHTSNEWQKDDCGHQAKSNMVYKMSCNIYEETKYDKAKQKSVPTAWYLSWDVFTNTPERIRSDKIAGQDRKRFTDQPAMERYLDGRIKAYEHLFTEISPPIPQEYINGFKKNGQLLPGYTIEGMEPCVTPKPEHSEIEHEAVSLAATLYAGPFVLTSDNPRDKLKEITGKLEQGIKDIFDSEHYKNYLNTMSKFHNYSMNNCMLIAMQKPDATRVAGFTAWRDNFKRNVVKGAKGIKILAPSPFKTKKEMEKIDPATQRPMIGKDGKPVFEEVEITVPAFKVATVFDLSQTEGEPLPEIGVNELSGSVDRYKDFLAALEKTSPVPVSFENITTGAKGYFSHTDKRIAINEGMSELQTLKTAIHEIAHSRLHDITPALSSDTSHPDQQTREVEAESVAYVVCQHYGLDTSDYSFGYVATWSGDKQLDTLKASLETIRKEADALITEIDKNLAELQQDKTQTTEQATPEKIIEQAPPEHGDSFTIYQLKDDESTRPIRFESLQSLEKAGQSPNLNNYEKVYAAPLDENVFLEKLYYRFNMHIPEDFKGHALSVSDVVTLNRDSEETAYYVDDRGFKELPGFIPPPLDLHVVADYLQKQYNSVAAADPDKVQGIAAFNAAIHRLNKANERIPSDHSQLKALITNAAQSQDLPTLKQRMETLKTEFIQHYATSQLTVDSGKLTVKPERADSVTRLSTNNSQLSTSTAKPSMKPSIKQQIAAGKDQLAKEKSAPPRAAAKNKNAGLEA